jgi:hypothetical protein
MDDADIVFTVHPLPKIMQGVARKKCFLGASEAGFGGIA